MEEKERYDTDDTSCLSPLEEADEAVAKRERRRQKIIKEMLDTERTYQNHLELIIQYFEGPVRELNLVPDHVIVTIFSNIRQILSLNQELMEHLSKTGVGQAFLRIGPFLKLYSTYANNHERALGAMIEWEQKKPEFGVWRRAQEEFPAMHGLKLNSLLITPVQRVPRYKLLLTDLLENTEKTHKDYTAIQESVKQIGAVASHINEHIRQQDNFNKMLAIQKCLAGPGAPRLLTPGRIFIKDGPLKKVAKKGGRSHERMFFLFSDIFLYAKPKFVDQVLSGSYVCCCILPLQHCKVDTVFGHSQSSGSLFTVTCKSESLLLYSDQKTVQSWMKVLRSAIQNVQTCRKTLRKPSSALQPLRRPGLIRLRQQQKKKDPLEMAKKTPDRGNPSPRSLKRALADANINCLTPRKHKVCKQDGIHNDIPKNICQNLNNVLNNVDKDNSVVLPDITPVKERHGVDDSDVTLDKESQGKQSVANRFMAGMRHISGKSKRKDSSSTEESKEKENSCVRWGFVSPQRDNKVEPAQGSECDISEILDPSQVKWDIFDTALPDASVVWQPALHAELPEIKSPEEQKQPDHNELDDPDERTSFLRPRSEISENTSRIWKARPDSEISDTDDLSTFYTDTPSKLHSEFLHDEENSDYAESPTWLARSVFHRNNTNVSRPDVASRYTFDEENSTIVTTQRIVHNGNSNEEHSTPYSSCSSTSPGSVTGYRITGANPWRYTEETYISEEETGRCESNTNSINDSDASQPSPSWAFHPDVIPSEWRHSVFSGSVYADSTPSHNSSSSHLPPSLEDENNCGLDQSNSPTCISCADANGVATECFHHQDGENLPFPQNHTPTKPNHNQKTPSRSPWKTIGQTMEALDSAAHNVVSPVMVNGQACALQ